MLVEELEPRHFLELLKGTNDGDDVVQTILTTKLRRDRSKLFLSYLMKSSAKDKTLLKRFLDELTKLKMHHILDILNPGKRHIGM